MSPTAKTPKAPPDDGDTSTNRTRPLRQRRVPERASQSVAHFEKLRKNRAANREKAAVEAEILAGHDEGKQKQLDKWMKLPVTDYVPPELTGDKDQDRDVARATRMRECSHLRA